MTATEETLAISSAAQAGQQPNSEDDVRARIFDSSLRLFSQRGYAATSLREVAEDAGASKPAASSVLRAHSSCFGASRLSRPDISR